MAPGLQRTHFNSSRLTRFLSELAVADLADGAPSTQSLADRLGSWLDWTDSIALSAALNSAGPTRPAGSRPGAPSAAQAAIDDFGRVRAALARSITVLEGFDDDLAGMGQADLAPYRRQYGARQRAMESAIAPLRASVRAALAGASPVLGRLAAMDAVLDQALNVRERHLLGKVPGLLERHVKRLRDSQPAPGGATTQPPGWLAVARKDLQGVLLAELELRLQPVEGMIEALGDGMKRRQ